VRQR